MTARQLIFHSLFLGFCAASVTLIFPVTPATGFTFCGTCAAYLFLRRTLAATHEQWKIWTTLLISGALAIGAFTLLSAKQRNMAYAGILILILYALPSRYSLRNIIVLKPLAIALCWALFTIGIASGKGISEIPNDHSVSRFFLHIFLLTYFLSLLYDLRDYHKIENSEKTIIDLLTERSFGYWFSIGIFLSILAMWVIGSFSAGFFAFAASCIYAFFLYLFHRRFSYLTYTWLVDAGFLIYSLMRFFFDSSFYL